MSQPVSAWKLKIGEVNFGEDFQKHVQYLLFCPLNTVLKKILGVKNCHLTSHLMQLK